MKEILDKKDVLDKLKALLSYAIIVDTSIPINENEGIGMGDIVQEIDDMDSLDPAVDLKEPFAEAQDKPDYEAIIKEIETYMCNEEYRLRTEGYAMVSGASRGENFLKKLKAKHTPVSRETDVREKPEEKDEH